MKISFQRKQLLSESTPYCAGKNPQDAKQSMEKLKQIWYGGRDGSHDHYDSTRYYALNLHAVFSKGTLEWRCFESTLHAGKVRANITLALAISAQAINQKCTPDAENEKIPRILRLHSVPFYCGWGSLDRNIKMSENICLPTWKGIGRGDMTAVSMNV